MSNTRFVRNLSMLLLVVSLMSGAAFAQPSSNWTWAETIIATSVTDGQACLITVTSGKSICAGGWSDPYGNSAGGSATAVTGYGTLKVYASSFVTANTASDGTLSSNAVSAVASYDTLNMIGLTVPAYLRLIGSVFPDPGLGTALYYIGGTSAAGGYECEITYPSSELTCTVTVPVNPGWTVTLQRELQGTALSSMTNFLAGDSDLAMIGLGWDQSKAYPSTGGKLIVSVRDEKGHVIKGITVVGASGHIYN